MKLATLLIFSIVSFAQTTVKNMPQTIPEGHRQIVKSGLTGYWPMNEGTGTNVRDHSTGGHNCTFSGTQTGTSGYYTRGIGPYAYAGTFDGSTNTVSCGNFLNIGTGAVTMAAWVKAPNSNQLGPIIKKRLNSTNFAQYGMQFGSVDSAGSGVSSKKLACFFYGGSLIGAQSYHSVADIADGNWHYVSCSRGTSSTNEIALYVDGQPVATISDIRPASAPDVNSTATLQFGYDFNSRYTGLMAGVAEWSRALTDAEQYNNYLAGHPSRIAPPCAPTTFVSTASTLAYHPVWVDGSGNLVSWLGAFQCANFGMFATSIVQFFLTSMPQDGLGHPYDYRYPTATIDTPPATQLYQQIVSGYAAPMIEAGLTWKAVTGDTALRDRAVAFSTFVLANGLTSGGSNWPSVPYSASSSGTIPYDGYEPASSGTAGLLEPDKLAWFGYALVKLYQDTGTSTWLTQAEHYADVLVDHLVVSPNASNSPWPFRVVASTGATATGNNSYTAMQVYAVKFLDELIANGWHGTHSIADYTATRNAVWNWIIAYPVSNGNWDNCCEDILGYVAGGNFASIPILDTAIYLLENPSSDPSSLTKAQALLTLIETNLGGTSFGNAPVIKEQIAFAEATSAACVQYAYAQALLSKATTGSTSTTAKQKALLATNWATYALPDYGGQAVVAMNISSGSISSSSQWWRTNLVSAEYALKTMQALPEWGWKYSR